MVWTSTTHCSCTSLSTISSVFGGDFPSEKGSGSGLAAGRNLRLDR